MSAALLVLDAQENMWAAPLHRGGEVLFALMQLVSEARSAGAMVVFVRNVGAEGAPDAPGTPGFELHHALQPRPTELVLDKRAPDAFEGTELEAALKKRSISRVIIAGMQTELCIEATCRAADARDLEVVLAKGAHSTFDRKREPAEKVIAKVERALGEIVAIVPWRDVELAGDD